MENDNVLTTRDSLMLEIFGSDLEDSSGYETHDEEREESYMENIQPSNSINVETGPQTGMCFESIESLFKAYQDYAMNKGFSVIKRARRKVNGVTKYVVLSCDRSRKVNFEISSKRIDCPARINAIKRDDGYWSISKICITHNHDLDPEMTILMKRQLEANDIEGIRPCKNVRVQQVQAGGGPQNLGCMPKERSRLILGDGDADAISKLFLRMQQRDRGFFHLMDLDDQCRLLNVLWIHPRSKAAYQEFHDVVSFDTTYLVHRYKMPLATIVGINHHGHSILLGCALVAHEDARSFK